MRYSKFLIFIIVCAFQLLVACDKDNQQETLASYKSEMFVNTWCSFDDFGQSIELTLNGTHKVTVEDNTTSGENSASITGTGTWMYYPGNNVLVMEVRYQTSPSNFRVYSSSYKVKELTNDKMTLIDQETGGTEIFYRLAEELTVGKGESLENILPANASFVNMNSNIISLDSNGLLTAVGFGVAYLLIEEGDSSYVVKITSLHQSQKMVSYLGESIEKILEVYGEPDVSGSLEYSLAVLYRNNLSEGQSVMQVQYDPLSLEITRILVLYNSKSIWQSDFDFIASWLNHEGEMYFPDHSMLESPYAISPFESQDAYYISYNNMKYFMEHHHFAPHKIIEAK